MYLAESEALAAAATAAVAKKVNGNVPDGKVEDYAAAGARMADLVAAGSRAASNVAGAILSLSSGSASGIHCGLSPSGGACGANGAGCDGSSTTAGGRGGGG